jgi:hypothetical protein
MAIISIPIGGRPVPIEVPDFAMEGTQRDILDVSKSIRDALGGVKTGSDSTQRAVNNLSRSIEQGNAAQKSLLSKMTSRMNIGGASEAVAGISRLGDETKAGAFSKRIFDAMGMANFGLQFGMAFGYAEELGEVMNKVARTGVNFGDRLIEVQAQAGSLGLTLDQFGKIVGTNGAMLAGLGDTTSQGMQRFLDLGNAVRDGTRQFGFFGMKSDEMAMVLADELEIRRQTVGTEGLRNLKTGEFTDQMVESLRINEAMAAITGQDVQERRKAGLEARRGAVAQSYLSEQTMATQQQFAKLAESLSTLGPQGKELSDAILSGIATGMDPRAFAPKLIAFLGDGAQDLIDFATNSLGDASISTEDFAIQSQALVTNLKNTSILNGQQARVMAVFGDSSAEALLAIETRTQAIDDVTKAYQKAAEEMVGDAEKNKGIRGLASTMDEVAASIKAATGTFIQSMTGSDGIANLGEAISGMAEGFSSTLAKPDSEFNKLIKAAGAAFGQTAIRPMMRLLGIEESNDLFMAMDAMLIASQVAGIAGQDKLASLLAGPTNANALISGIESYANLNMGGVMSPEGQAALDDIKAELRKRDDPGTTQNEGASMSEVVRLLKELSLALNAN